MKSQIVRSNGMIKVLALAILVLLLGSLAGCALNQGKLLTHTLSEPLSDTKTARFEVNTGSGNLTIDTLTGGEPLLAGGTLQYYENLGEPARTLVSFNGQTNLALKWNENGAPCTGAIEWLIHLNPTVPSDITARSGGGNVRLNLVSMSITHLAAETGGGNMDVVLPDNAAKLNVSAKTGGGNVTVEIGGGTTGSSTLIAGSGAGNVIVRIPSDIAARIHATTGLGKVVVASQFNKIDDKTYQSPGYESAANKIEITLTSGAGNVEVNPK